MIQALLIDLDGVIRLWDPEHDRITERRFGLPPGTMQAVAFAPDLLEPAITGEMSDKAWRKRIAQRLAEQFPACDAVAATQFWSAPVGEIDHQALSLVRQCRQSIPVGLVSNATSRLPQDLKALQVHDEFDVIFNSSVIGAAKPSPAIFQAAVDALGVERTATLFIDDHPGHVRAGRELGIKAYVYQDPPNLQQILQRYNLA